MVKEIRDDLKYTDSHEWIKVEEEKVIIGITDHAQSELTDIVFAELPVIGKEIKKGDELCVVESVKSVSEINSPISGKIINVNEKLEDNPEIINKKPYDEGWLVEIKIANIKEINDLLEPEEYKKLIE
ncbi:MAG: glycine cleavage system protein GcvH [Candidatus Thermoplasmatota archaeon]|nr:glycine cleavage system protein GcvH [Candidatus Thermoplasmatota archaeon]MCK5301385.1 glycine cleavage system protein GcvH [Thermoplasmatales archaeon]